MKYISSIIDKHIPQFIRMEYPNFVTFIRAYYEWAEKNGRGYEFIANLQTYIDVDRTSIDILEHFASIYLSPLPNIIYERNNLKTLIKNISQHYLAKGSEKSFKFLFRLIDNTDVDFYYPSADMLRISDGKWTLNNTIKIINPPVDVKGWMSGVITGRLSEISAVIDYVDVYHSTSGFSVAELFIQKLDVTKPLSSFIPNEIFDGITVFGDAFTGTIIPEISTIDILNAGKYYKKGIQIKVISSTGEDSSIIIDGVSKGVIDSVSIIAPGTGYVVGDPVIFEAIGFGSGAYGSVSAIGIGGSITTIKMISNGHDYTSIPVVTVKSLAGSGAVLMAESSSIGKIIDYEIRNFGLHYDDGDTIKIPIMLRTYNRHMDFDVGEAIHTTSGGIGIIISHDKINGVMAVNKISGTFVNGETLTGQWHNATAKIYDQSTASMALSMGPVCKYKGRYINTDGHISSNKYIQDSYFYQVFSYMIKTFIKRDVWVDYIKPVHPAGMISFGYREVPNKQKMFEYYAGFYGPTLEATELFKFKWLDGNTQIKQYKNIKIDTIANINIHEKDKTNFCFGSEILLSNGD
jgi:hypothetical protein